MAKLVGVVSKVVGQVFAIADGGSRRPLIEGDRLYAGEQLETGAAGAVAVRLQNGAELTLGRDSSLTMTPDLFATQAHHAQGHDTAPSDAQLSDVARIQQAIAAGDDPTQSAEATAAGAGSPSASGALGGGHSFVLLSEVGARVDPVVGFPTAGFNGVPELANREVGGLDPSNRSSLSGRPVGGGDGNGDTPSTEPSVPTVDENHPVTLLGLDIAPGELSLNEANLPLGSASDAAALTQRGSFTVVAQDGVFILNVGGINVVTGGVVTGVGQSIATGLGNILTITGYNASTGEVSYSYTLTASGQHSENDGTKSLTEHLPVLVSDSDGDVAQGSLDVIVHDDAPQAFDDGNVVTATEQQVELTGNVLTNDIQGADRMAGGPVMAGTYTGSYGILVLAADGSYTYTLNPNAPDFKSLGGGGNGVEHFTYTIKDADGDTSTATLTLNISNLNDPVTLDGLDVQNGELTVYEKNLSDGTSPDTTALTQQGTFKVTALDGLQSLTVGGIAVVTGGVAAGFPQSVTTPEGNTLTITGYNATTGVVRYSYTLTGNESHPDGAGTNGISEHFDVVAKDVDGSTATGSLDVNIVDDVPKAVDDSNAVTATEQQVELTGNVLTNDIQGADRVAGGPVIAGTYTGTYGTLLLAADGSYTYTLNPNAPDFKSLGGGGNGVENFTYTIKDADGDTSTATLTLSISNLNDPVTLDGLDVQNGELTVYEKNLSDGTSPDADALTQQGTFKVTAADGLQSLTVGGIAVVTGGVAAGFPQSVTTPEGNTLTITGYNATTGVVSYSYTLTGNESHPDGAGTNSMSEHFDVVAKDADGSTATGSLDVNIVDDVPKAVDDSHAVTATEQQVELTGNVLTNDIQGADRVAGGPVIAGTYTGTYGTLLLAADGSYTYTLNPNAPAFKSLGGGGNGVEHFTYTIKDADGDTSTATLTLNISNLNDPVTLDGLDVQNGELTVYEKNLSDGASPDADALTQQGTFKVTALDGLQSLTVGGIAVVTGGVAAGFPRSVTTPEGNTLTITGYNATTGVVSYSYTLTGNESHPDGAGTNSMSEHFDVVAKDADGSTATGSLDVNIVDDVPLASADTTSVVEGGTATGNVLWNDKLGADQAGTSNVVVGARAGSDTSTSAIGNLNSAIVGQYGTLTIDAAGNAVYHANPNAVPPQGASDLFVYTIRDTDGDESTTTITINVQNCSLVAGPVGGVTVHESALDVHQDGNDLAPGTVTGSDPDATRETASGSLAGTASGGVGALTYSLVGDATGQYGQIHLNADGTYTYTLTSPANSPTHADDGPNTVTETFTYQVKDSVGNSTTSTLVITIVDDVPQAHSDYTSVYKGDEVRGNVLYNDVVGADVRSDGNYVVGVRAGNDTSTSAIGQLNTQVGGQYGYLTLDEKGNAVYHSNPDVVSPRDAVDTFVYTLRDADGDESTTTITINVHNSLMACEDRDVTVYENALDLHKDGNDLAAGSVAGSDPDSTRETAIGTLVGSASGGVGALTYTLVGDAAGQYGQIHLNADGTYTYTLTSPANSPTHADDGPNTVTETFTYQVKDSVGNSTTSTLVITIVDDVPQAHSDYTSVYKGDEVRGNVLYNDVVGADVRSDGNYVVGVRAGNDTSTSAIGQLNTQVGGQYGYLTLDEKGNAVYHSNPNVVSPRDAVDTFVYTLRDADGDESTTTITINVHNSLMACEDRDVTVYENALDLHKDGNDLAAGSFTGSDPDSTRETATGTLVGSASGGVGALTYTLVGDAAGQYGQIHLNADGTYTYTLTSPANSPTHADDGPNTVTETFTYQVKDSVGNSTTSTLVITIVDDVPQAHSDYTSVYKGDEVRGNVLYNDVVGADVRSDGNYVVGVRAGNDTSTSAIGQLNTQVGGQYGYLTLDEKGNAVYHSNPDVVSPRDAVDTFVYTIRDADGDESTTTITINVHDPRIEVCMDGGVTVFEKALDRSKDGSDLAAGTVTGSDPTSPLETASGSLVGLASGGIGALSYSLVSNAVGQYGQIQLNADGSYTYTLTSAANSPTQTNDGANTVTESFTYQVQDAYGHSATSTIVISIVDDVPQAHCDFVSVYKGDEVRGNVMYNDVVGADVRSDGNYVVGVRAGSDTSSSAIGHLNSQVIGQYGYLTLDEKGNAVYHSNPDVVSPRDAVDTFVYTLRDADGDESTTTLTINVHDATLVACVDRDVTVFEKALDLHKDGNDLAAGSTTGSDPASPGETASGSLVGSVSGGVGALTYSLVGNAVGQYGQISVNPDGSYSYTLTSPANTPGADSTVEYFTYKATDSLGHSITSNIAITIVDDVPNAVCAERSITAGKLDSNILLVIDVSGSMDSASGIPGLTRLDAAKQAIAALLDKYDGMGDIKVQIVTFSGGAQIQSAQWVSIDAAKSIVNGLHAGGSTYYDSAATAAQTAFEQNGKLAGAQNVSYFFSDGEPSSGHAMTASRETSWETFLDSNGIKSYAIGLGKDINAGNLNPLAYDGSSHTDTNAVIVNDFNQLYGVLSGTVQGSPITGSLLSDGTFGADGGFIKALLVDGTTYTYDPKANAGQGGYLASGGPDNASFDTAGNTLAIKTSLGGSLLVNMDSGEFTYTPPSGNTSSPPERFGFMVSDNDGDTSSADLLIMINGNHAPAVVADPVITNITGASITLPSEVLLANDSDPDNDHLSAAPITVNTHFADKGAGFSLGNSVPNITFDGHGNTLDNQFKALDRSAFTTAAGSMTAALVVLGYLGDISSNANGEDVITVSLRKGETLQLDHDRPDGNLSLQWKDANGSYQPIADGGSFTASHDGVYSIRVVNQANPSDHSNAAENYKLSLLVDYSNAMNEVHQASYTVTDGHGGSAVGAVDITYHAGTTLNGTAGNDVLMASNVDTFLNGGDGHDVLVGGAGNDTLYGGSGNDLLIGGLGNDLLDGGAGIDTASYASATGGVTVDLSLAGPQNTGAAGIDTLTGIENLIGSDYNDTLIGDAGDNVLNGGLGNDVLKGGDGNDTLIGGPGDDIMTGGNGDETFVWQKGDTGHDTVTDFTPGSDHLDLSQLLQGENATPASLDDYLHFKVSGSGTHVVSTIEVSSVAGAAPTQTIDLAGVDLAQHYGVTAGAGGVISAGHDTATIITGMINDHSLKVDTV